MTEHARLDSDTGALLVSVDAWREMLRRTGAIGDARSPHREAWEALIKTGAAQGDRLHPTLARPLEAVGAPLAELRIERRAAKASGWVDADAAVLLVPRGEGLLEVAPAALRFLPDLVARLVELVPRPAEKRLPLTVAPGALAVAIADRGSVASASAVPAVRDFWLVETTEPHSGRVMRRLEVLDTDDGLWKLEREEHSVRLEPATTSGVRRDLTATLAPSGTAQPSDGQ